MRHLSIVRVAVMQKTDTAACRRQAVQNTNLLQKALAKIRMAKVAAAFTTWMDQWRMLRIGRCCLRKMVHRRKLISLRRWQKATKQRIFARLEAAAKASRIDSEEKERALQTKLAEGSAMMERLSVLVARQRVSKDLRMRARIGWKQWQVAWLSAKLVKVREAHAAETLQVHLGAEKEKGKLLRRKKQLEAEVSTLQGRIAAIKEDAKKGPRKRAAELEARAAAAEEELEQVAALKAELSAMSEKAAGALLAKEAAERSAAAHKSALERAHVVQTEELRGTQGRRRDSLTSCATGSSAVCYVARLTLCGRCRCAALQKEVDQQRQAKQSWQAERHALERAAGRVRTRLIISPCSSPRLMPFCVSWPWRMCRPAVCALRTPPDICDR